MEFHHPVGGAVDADLADDVQDHVLGEDPFGEHAVDVKLDRLGLAEGADPLQDADFQVGRADAGGKGAEGSVGAGVGIAHDDRVAGADEAFLREEGVADAIGADVEKVLDGVAAGPVSQNLGLCRGFSVLAGGDMVDHGLDLGWIKDAVLVPADQVVDRNRRRDFVAEYRIQPQYFCAGERLVHQVSIKNLFSSCSTHIQ